MLEQIKYVNHINEILVFGESNMFINANDLHDFDWESISQNDKISSFKKSIKTKTVPVVIKCNTESEGIAARNNLFEICEKDVLALQHGKLWIGDYYLKCYVTSAKITEYLKTKEYMIATLTISTDFPQWIKETNIVFNPGQSIQGDNLDYNNDFPYDYSPNILDKKLNNTDFVATNFRLRIFGACSNPKVTIAGHDYQVNVDVAEGEYLTIDSIDKTIILTRVNGVTDNEFNKRNKSSYIFEKIPNGQSNVSTSADFLFDITLLEERGIPKWT